MITKQYSHYLPFLAQNYNILLLSNKHYDSFDEVSHLFSSGAQRNTHQSEFDNITITLIRNKTDIVLLDATEDSENAKRFLEALRKHNDRVVIVTIIGRESVPLFMEFATLSDHLLFDSFSIEELKAKLVQIVSVFYTIMSIGRREINLKSGSSDLSNLVNFLDFYEGSSLFIVDELMELNQRFKAGEFSKELLNEMGGKILEISEIFSKNELLIRVAPIFKELGDFLNQLEFSTLQPSGLKGFDYLSNIIDDLNKNMMDIFVDRIFHDVHVFEDSLKNNIEFMKNCLYTHSDDQSELDFF